MGLSNHKSQIMHYLSVDTFRWSTWMYTLPLPTPTHPYLYLPHLPLLPPTTAHPTTNNDLERSLFMDNDKHGLKRSQ